MYSEFWFDEKFQKLSDKKRQDVFKLLLKLVF